MSFRPTIAVIAEGGIADIGYYRNWEVEDLFIEAVALAVTHRGIKTVEEFRQRVFGTQKMSYIIEPEIIENTQENLEWMLDCSEFPITVDLKNEGIYLGLVDSREEFDSIPDIDVLEGLSRDEEYYWDVLENYKIPFRKLDFDYLRDLFLKDDDLRSHLSIQTKGRMEERFKERIGELDDEAGVHNEGS
ncbi:MAG: hypothetical protein J6Q41_00835 [Firmicutes bacterium]|nr:hypothetical protein [Bacillota bacterium]